MTTSAAGQGDREEFYWGCFKLPTLPHVTYTPTLRRGSSSYNCLTRVSCLLLVVARHLSRSQVSICPSNPPLYIETSIAIYRHIASLQGSADGPSLTLPSNAFMHKTVATGEPLLPNCTHSCSHLDCERSPINQQNLDFGCSSSHTICISVRSIRCGIHSFPEE
jgi:hypothetical protein